MVVTELDFLKNSASSNEKLKRCVVDAIKFINTLLKDKKEKVVGEYLTFSVLSPDVLL